MVPSEWLEIIRLSVKAEGSLTARPTSQSGTKVGLSDPVVPHGRAIALRIKATTGITGLSPPRVHINEEDLHINVGSLHPGDVVSLKGGSVRPLKRYASWVQNVVRQFGPYPSWAFGSLKGAVLSTRGPGWTHHWCTSCSARSIAG